MKREPLTVELVKEIHRILAAGTYDERRYIENEEHPGDFKKHDYVTGIHEVGSDAAGVEQYLTELLDEVNAYNGDNILKVVAYLQYARFKYIHPFVDGNDRVSRTILNYYLMTRNHLPIIIYDEERWDYYAALQLTVARRFGICFAQFAFEKRGIRTKSS